jgi:TolB-like protein
MSSEDSSPRRNQMKAAARRSSIIAVLAVFVCFCSTFALAQDTRAASADLASELEASGRKTVAVVDFTDLQGCVTELGRYMAEDISVSLAKNAKGFQVIDRTNLNVLLEEHKLASTGIIDPATARKLGQIAGVDALVTGTIAPLSDSVHVSAKLLDTKSAMVLGGTTVDMPRTKNVEELLAKGVTNCGSTPLAMGSPGGGQRQSEISPTQIQTLEYHQYRFDLQSCERSGNSIECNLAITNRSSDQDLTIYANCNDAPMRSRLIDAQGREVVAKLVLIGSHQNANWSCLAKSTLVSGTRTQTMLSFENIPADTKSIAMLEITCHEGPNEGFAFNEKFRVQFRNIPVSQKRY